MSTDLASRKKRGLKKTVKKVGSAAKKAVKKVGSAAKKAVKKVGSAAKKTVKKVGSAAKKPADWLKTTAYWVKKKVGGV